ncbi:hypothetical protein BT69DRAFT_1298194 [Atractiella rhizophila]|nr:hypothetical protein BT69DRAFT_1298194 [Atractiella rhizophila]
MIVKEEFRVADRGLDGIHLGRRLHGAEIRAKRVEPVIDLVARALVDLKSLEIQRYKFKDYNSRLEDNAGSSPVFSSASMSQIDPQSTFRALRSVVEAGLTDVRVRQGEDEIRAKGSGAARGVLHMEREMEGEREYTADKKESPSEARIAKKVQGLVEREMKMNVRREGMGGGMKGCPLCERGWKGLARNGSPRRWWTARKGARRRKTAARIGGWANDPICAAVHPSHVRATLYASWLESRDGLGMLESEWLLEEWRTMDDERNMEVNGEGSWKESDRGGLRQNGKWDSGIELMQNGAPACLLSPPTLSSRCSLAWWPQQRSAEAGWGHRRERAHFHWTSDNSAGSSFSGCRLHRPSRVGRHMSKEGRWRLAVVERNVEEGEPEGMAKEGERGEGHQNQPENEAERRLINDAHLIFSVGHLHPRTNLMPNYTTSEKEVTAKAWMEASWIADFGSFQTRGVIVLSRRIGDRGVLKEKLKVADGDWRYSPGCILHGG